MSSHKVPRINARNWEQMVEEESPEVVSNEKLRHHRLTAKPADNAARAVAKGRQGSSDRTRYE